MKSTHVQNISLKRNAIPVIFDMVQFDTGNIIALHVRDVAIPGGTTAKAYFQKPSGHIVYKESGITVSGQQITIPVDNQAIAEVGDTLAQVTLYNGSDTLSTFDFTIKVYASRKDWSIQNSTTVIDSFEQAVQDAIAEIGTVLDPTLSQANKAAQAKATGDAISKLNTDLSFVIRSTGDVNKLAFAKEDFELGTRNPETGDKNPLNRYITTSHVYLYSGQDISFTGSFTVGTYETVCHLYCYAAGGAFLGRTTANQSVGRNFTIPEGTRYIAPVFGTTDTSASFESVDDLISSFSLNVKTRVDKAIEGKADASDLDEIEQDLMQTKEDLSALNEGNIIGVLVEGEYVNDTTGAIVQNAGYKRTGFIDVSQYNEITVRLGGTSKYNAYYTADKTFIRSFAVLDESATIYIPENCKYIVFSFRNTYTDQSLRVNKYEYESYKNDISEINDKIGTLSLTEKDVTTAVFTDAVNGYIRNNGAFTSSPSSLCSDFIKVNAGERYVIKTYVYANNVLGIAFYNSEKSFVSGDAYSTTTGYVTKEVTVPQGVEYARFSVYQYATKTYYVHKFVSEPISDTLARLEPKIIDDVLCGKKLYVVGDSVSYGARGDAVNGEYPLYNTNGEDISGTNNAFKTHHWYTAKRNKMHLVQDAISGSICPLSKEYLNGSEPITSRNPYSYQRYLNAPEDADYITIWFGINDSGHSNLGTIDDTTNETFYGAFNVVIPYLINKCRNAKIGLVVTTRVGSDDLTNPYRLAVKELAKKWGLSTLDFYYDPKIPYVQGREESIRPCEELIALRNAQWFYSTASGGGSVEGDEGATTYESHPIDAGYKHISTIYENWLRSM